jgi:hypothetical protein
MTSKYWTIYSIARCTSDLDALADMAAILIEGALVLSRALRDPKIPAQQVMLHRDFVRCVFAKG